MVVLHLFVQDEKLNNMNRLFQKNLYFLPKCNATAPPSERPNKKIFS
jgi:hypothetical protein